MLGSDAHVDAIQLKYHKQRTQTVRVDEHTCEINLDFVRKFVDAQGHTHLICSRSDEVRNDSDADIELEYRFQAEITSDNCNTGFCF